MRFIAGIVVALSTFGAMGCGDDGSSATDSGPATTTATSTSAGPTAGSTMTMTTTTGMCESADCGVDTSTGGATDTGAPLPVDCGPMQCAAGMMCVINDIFIPNSDDSGTGSGTDSGGSGTDSGGSGTGVAIGGGGAGGGGGVSYDCVPIPLDCGSGPGDCACAQSQCDQDTCACYDEAVSRIRCVFDDDCF